MSRLAHSRAAYVRLMQMSRTQAFVFVEGWTDRTAYDSICELEGSKLGITHELRTSHELPGSPSGKPALILFYDYLRRRKALLADFKGKRTGVLFFLDKDIDDFLRIRRRSGHLVYTEHYDFENYVFIQGDIVRAGAMAAALDLETVRTVIGNPEEWRRRAADEWKTWIQLCIVAQIFRASCGVSYRRPSHINRSEYGGVDPIAEANHRDDLSSMLSSPCIRARQRGIKGQRVCRKYVPASAA